MPWSKTTPTTTTKISASYTIFTTNWDCIEDWSGVDHYGLTSALSGRHIPGSSLWYANSTANIAALSSPAPCAAAVDTTLNSLKYYSGAAWVDCGGVVPSGTRMFFYADTAPVGWTIAITDKDSLSLNDQIIYITKGSVAGGSEGGKAKSGGTWTDPTGHTHTSDPFAFNNEYPAHTHTVTVARGYDTSYLTTAGYAAPQASEGASLTVKTPSSGTLTQYDQSTYSSSTLFSTGWRPAAYCFIVCVKD